MTRSIQEIAQALVAEGKGILAADESVNSMNKRLAKIGVPETSESARAFRELLFTTPGFADYVTGVILYDETLRQSTAAGKPFPLYLESIGVVPGIKVDKGLVPLPNFPDEEFTEGLDGLSLRLKEYYELGARFTKWRAVIRITDELPSEQALYANMHALTLYAALVQEAHMVPMVEPEVLFEGTHTLERSAEVVERTMELLFDDLYAYGVALDGLILKTSYALPGKDSGEPLRAMEIAKSTFNALVTMVPPEVAGVVFLSGGQSPVQATENLQAIAKVPNKPWPMTFSYSRALQEPALEAWRGLNANTAIAQEAFRHRLELNARASQGRYDGTLE